MEFVLEAVAGIVASKPSQRTSLNHEIRDDTMKNEAIEKRTVGDFSQRIIDETFCAFRESNKIRGGSWHESVFETAEKYPFACVKACVKTIACRLSQTQASKPNADPTTRRTHLRISANNLAQ